MLSIVKEQYQVRGVLHILPVTVVQPELLVDEIVGIIDLPL